MSQATTATKPAKYWIGTVPSHDDFGMPIESMFIDGATRQGPWAFMTPTSFLQNRGRLGQGRGQMYEKQADGRWLKIAG